MPLPAPYRSHISTHNALPLYISEPVLREIFFSLRKIFNVGSDEEVGVPEVTSLAHSPTAGDWQRQSVTLCLTPKPVLFLPHHRVPRLLYFCETNNNKKKPFPSGNSSLYFSPTLPHNFQNPLQTSLCLQGLRTSNSIGNNPIYHLPL